MKKCSSCGHTNNDKNAFCSGCGKSMANEPSTRTHNTVAERRTQRRKTPIFAALAVILVIGLFTSYFFISKKFSEESVMKEFKSALIKKDKDRLKEIIVPSDSRLKVNNESLDALFTLIDQEPSVIQEIENSLHDEGLGSNLFSLRKDGKHYGIFDRYVVDTPGYFIRFDDPDAETTVYLNNSEIGILEDGKKSEEFGPFLTGSYDMKVSYIIEGKEKEETTTVLLTGTKTTAEIQLNMKSNHEENKTQEEKQTIVIKEIIKEVPSNSGSSYNYYILANSSYQYLTYSDIAGLSKSQLRLARNEIYARHGYLFKSKDLQNYFYSQEWYRPNPSYDGTLSSVEEHNVQFIKLYE